MKRKQSSIAMRITAITLAVLLISTVSIGVFGYVLNRQNAVALSADKALALAKSLVYAIDSEQFEQVMASMEKTEHWHFIKQLADDIFDGNHLDYLYILQQVSDDQMMYFAEGYPSVPREDEPPLDLGDFEGADIFDAGLFETLRTGEDVTTGLYDSGDYGVMVSGFSAIKNSLGQVIGVVGVDISVEDAIRTSNTFGIQIVIFVIVLSLVCSFFIIKYVSRSIGKPLSALAQAGEKIALGDTDIHTNYSRNDEIGALSASFEHMVSSAKAQSEVFLALADGDLTVDIQPRSKNDTMNIAIGKMIANLNSMFNEINHSSSQVSAGAHEISETSQALARGSSEQASAVQQLLSSIEDVAQRTKKNAEMASKADRLGDEIKQNAQKGNAQMQHMLTATREIGEASQAIEKIIKVIDDIAFQTNILALNASVEAARAGQHGKGFAVVAEEVRNLASKSADAAKETGVLITNSIQKSDQGAKIAAAAADSLAEIVRGINQNSQFIGDISKSSGEQATAIDQINAGIDLVSRVVTQNNQAAEQSAAASQQMSDQAENMESLVSRFSLRTPEHDARLLTSPRGSLY